MIFNLLSLASLACLRNSAAFVVFGKGLVVFLLFVDVLFNLIGLLPVKQEKSLKLILTEKLENANVNFLSFFVITNLYSEFIDSFESSFNLRTVVKDASVHLCSFGRILMLFRIKFFALSS